MSTMDIIKKKRAKGRLKMGDKQVILKMLSKLYGDGAESIYKKIESLLEKYNIKS